MRVYDATPSHSPFDQLHGDKVVPISAVEEDEAVGRGGFELEEQVHGGVRLQGGQAQVAAFGLESDGIGDNEAHAEASVELAEIDVAVLAHVDVLHTVELEALGRGRTEFSINDKGSSTMRKKKKLSQMFYSYYL